MWSAAVLGGGAAGAKCLLDIADAHADFEEARGTDVRQQAKLDREDYGAFAAAESAARQGEGAGSQEKIESIGFLLQSTRLVGPQQEDGLPETWNGEQGNRWPYLCSGDCSREDELHQAKIDFVSRVLGESAGQAQEKKESLIEIYSNDRGSR